MDDDKVWSGFSMTSRRNVARAIATVLGALVMLTAALQGTALAAGPELTIQPLSGNATDDQMPTFKGTTNDRFDGLTSVFDPVTLDIYEGPSASGSPVQAWTTFVPTQEGVLEDSWEITPASPLEQGEYTAVAEQTSAETGPGASVPVTFRVETRPVVTLVFPTEHAVLKASRPTLSGEAGTAAWDGEVLVLVHEGGSTAGKVVASEDVSVSAGGWSYAPQLSDGVYTVQAAQQDEVGDTGASAAVTFTVNANLPPVTLTSPEPGAVVDTSNPTLGGGAGAAPWDQSTVTVTVHEGGSTAGKVVVSGSVATNAGTWSYSPHLSDGLYTAQATQGDEAGETGTSAPITFTIDTTTPIVSIDAVPPLTNSATLTLAGEAEAASWDNPFVTVAIHEGARLVISERASVIAGAWSYTTPHLADGSYSVQVSESDEAGHTGTSDTVTFTIDTTKPAVSLTKPTNQADLTVSEPAFSGVAGHAAGDEPSITLKIYETEGGPVSETPIQEVKNLIPNTAHEWTTGSTGPRLPNGIYVAVAEQADEAGNVGKSKATAFTIATRSPEVTLDTSGFVQRGARLLTGPSPSFNGTGATEPEDVTSVSVNIYAGTSASGVPVRSVSGPLSGSSWATPAVGSLEDGTYTVQAEQTDANPFSQPGVSNTVTFTVDADPPNVTLTAPANGSATANTTVTFSGAAGTDEGDLKTVTVQLYSGSAIAQQTPLEGITVPASASWSGALGGLSPGTYTAQAEQRDDVGNIGRSEAVTFTVVSQPSPAVATPSPPTASFKWIPANPQAGEPVTLASNSTAGSSPIVSYAWSLAGNGVFTRGESTLTTVFATPGSYTVQLRVTDANALSSTVAEKVAVATAAIPLMQPFPVVRMAGSFSRSGARITLLAALAPVGANVRITCHGKGCATKSQGFVAAAGAKSKSGTVQITFKRFERFLRSGVVVEIWISKHGQIGKFTRFVIHAGKSPTRVDQCLNPAGTTPIVCPS